MMKLIAIPTREGMVDDHFGHCAYYTVVTFVLLLLIAFMIWLLISFGSYIYSLVTSIV